MRRARGSAGRPRAGPTTPILAGLMVALLTGGCGGSSPVEFRSIGTGGTGGVYYPLGGALAAELSVADSTRRYTAEVTGGSVENVNRVLAGQIDLGFALSVALLQADTTRLRIAAPLYANLVHVLVTGDGTVASLDDLAGRAVAVGSPGSGTERTAREILASRGLDYDDVDERFLSFTEAASALKDRAIDAAIISVGYPAAAVLDAMTATDVRLLSWTREEVSSLVALHPAYDPAEIPAGVYPGPAESTTDGTFSTVSMMNWLVVRDDLPDEIVAAAVEILLGEDRPLARVHDMAGRIDGQALGRAPIPLHGAVAGALEGPAGGGAAELPPRATGPAGGGI